MNSFTSAPSSVERSQAVPLCLANGRLNPAAIGWSRHPTTHCALPKRLFRRKRWNDWRLLTPDWMLAITIADLDYTGYANLHFIDLHNGRQVIRTVRRFLAQDIHLPDTPHESIVFKHADFYLEANESPEQLELIVRSTDLVDSPLSGRFVVEHPRHLESINLVAPLGPMHFHCASRKIGLPVHGELSLGSQHFHAQAQDSFVALDFGRGIWPYHSQWIRAAFAGPGGIAGNFGQGWTEGSGLSENALWIGSVLNKIDADIHFEQDSQRPGYWHLRDDAGRIQLHFTRLQEQRSEENVGFLKMHRHLAYGRFDGMLIGNEGQRVKVDSLMGWIGKNAARW
ncbi:DUF2804 domain-containing protein [Atopomonas sediminilitoris]|uniref:DUF2804 domain-containing protein n=1 Tax=Atopomonas sediminilitoris TaxID=2919919 RepID=UPI001F4E4A67|nr:DUF2804 domain-containing protein [Atopomonas sediminilitoris]MCJ8168827.1 DUF2804 domain-containing protein [Atopomonas sediminilitoris]